jgi:hypothetical protein
VPQPHWQPSLPRIRRIDAAWFAVERGVCAVMFLTMASLVMAAVITETFGSRREWMDVAILFALAVLGARTRAVKEGEGRWRWGTSLAVAAMVTIVVAGAVYVYTEQFPGGFI